MKAHVVFNAPDGDHQHIQLVDHKFQVGGSEGGYCYTHQSFDCWESLSDKELEAINNAEEIE